MPIEDIQIVRAPRGWTPTADEQARIQADPRLQRLKRDDLYHAMRNRPAQAQGTGQGAMTNAESAMGNAMSWHPRELLNYVTSKIRGATGY